jgi:ABC-2 type transport system permease protein
MNNSVTEIDFESVVMQVVNYYVTMYCILFSITVVSNEVISCSKTGFIEQILISPYGLIRYIMSRIVGHILQMLTCLTIILLGLFILTGVRLPDVGVMIMFYLVIFCGVFSLFGLGIILGGISLISKEIYSLVLVARIVLVYLIMFSSTNLFVPFSVASELLYNIALSRDFILISTYEIFLVIGNSLFFFLFGLVVFKKIETYSLKTGRYIGY